MDKKEYGIRGFVYLSRERRIDGDGLSVLLERFLVVRVARMRRFFY